MRISILLISLYLLYYFNLKVERKIQFVSEIDYMMDNKSQARKKQIFSNPLIKLMYPLEEKLRVYLSHESPQSLSPENRWPRTI